MIIEDEVIIARYYMETPKSLEKITRNAASEQSTGLGTRSGFETGGLIETYGAKVVSVDSTEIGDLNKGIVEIAYPIKNFGPVIPMLLTTVAGNLFELAEIKNVKLLDLDIPPAYLSEFKGPKFGASGTRKTLGVFDRPLLGCVIKPCVGLEPETFAQAAYEASVGGVDFIKDDELISNPAYSPIEVRTSATMEALDRAEEETGEKTLYAVNVTDEVANIMGNAESAISNGATCLMINVIVTGFSALRMLAEDQSIKVPIHCHRDMFAAFARSPAHGISSQVVSKLARLCGADHLHAGSIDGKLFEDNDTVIKSSETMRRQWGEIKPTLPVSSGGQNPCTVEHNFELLGNDFLILAGSGIFGHKDGATSGAKAMRQALNLAISGTALKDCPVGDKELKTAIRQWQPSLDK